MHGSQSAVSRLYGRQSKQLFAQVNPVPPKICKLVPRAQQSSGLNMRVQN